MPDAERGIQPLVEQTLRQAIAARPHDDRAWADYQAWRARRSEHTHVVQESEDDFLRQAARIRSLREDDPSLPSLTAELQRLLEHTVIAQPDPDVEHTRRDDLESDRPKAWRLEPSLYVVLEGERPLAGGMRVSLMGITEVRVGRGPTRCWRVHGSIGELDVPDARMSRQHAKLVLRGKTWTVEDLGSTNGTYVAGSRLSTSMIEGPTNILFASTAVFLHPSEATKIIAPSSDSRSVQDTRGLVTLVPQLQDGIPRLRRVARSTLPVLLLGESGVGKEVLARAVHELSERTGAFVAINCGALAPNLVESQLFGYVRGAFSGAARDEPGLVRASAGGTLFLDEIGELPAGAQAALLRVLQEREVLPVGGTRPIPVDLRIVSATLKPIAQHAEFRADLYARIAGYVHRVPPLRERSPDLGVLIADLLPAVAGARAPSIRFAPELVTALVGHTWPLNVRELSQALSVAVVTASSDLLHLDDLGQAFRQTEPGSPRASQLADRENECDDERGSGSFRARPLTEAESALRAELLEALTRARGNITEVARGMGKTRTQIHRWMRRFGIDPERYRN